MTAGRARRAENDEPARCRPTTPARRSGSTCRALTITFGFGPALFERGDDRFGLAARRPARAAPICRALPADALDPAISGGDLCVQACSDDPQVAFHAVRNLARIGRGTVVMRWSQLGFGRTSTTTASRTRPAT